MGQKLTGTLEERLAKYCHMAAIAREAATNAKTQEARVSYISLAAAWESLAFELQDARKHPKDMLAVTQKVAVLSVRHR